MNFLLVGAGQLGSRHLQAIAVLPAPCTVYVSEPNPDARAQAEARWRQVGGHKNKKLLFNSLTELSTQSILLNAAIIATLSANRPEVLSQVLALGVKNILCEKVLFQSVAAWRQALQRVAAARAKVYVNHPFRYIPLFCDIRQLLAETKAPLSMHIEAGNVGMGCNLIHQLDLLEYLTARPLSRLEVRVDQPLLPCKRGAGYIEFTGVAEGETAGGDRFWQRCAGPEATLPEMTLTFAERKFVVNIGRDEWVSGGLPQPLLNPKVSELTTQLLPEIMAGNTLMPALEESFPANRLMLNAFNQSLNGQYADDTLCRIT